MRLKLGDPAAKRLAGPLGEYPPLRWELVCTVAQRRQWRELLARPHYLGAPELVGANLKYWVLGREGQWLAALGWPSAVQLLGCRDRLLGWNAVQRAGGLDHVVNHVRFLLLPWVKVANLASVILSESLCVLQRDWIQHYGVAVWRVESFVDRQRFSAASSPRGQWAGRGLDARFCPTPRKVRPAWSTQGGLCLCNPSQNAPSGAGRLQPTLVDPCAISSAS